MNIDTLRRRAKKKFGDDRWRCIRKTALEELESGYRVIFNGLYLTRVYYKDDLHYLVRYLEELRSFSELEALLEKKRPQEQLRAYRLVNALFDCSTLVPKGYSEAAAVGKVRSALNKEGVRITTAFMQFSLNCNLKCPHCFIFRNERLTSYPVMSVEEIERYVRYFLKNVDAKTRSAQIVFYGGEPCLYPNLIQHCVEYANRLASKRTPCLNMQYSIRSNGTLVDDAFLRFLKKNRVVFAISIDGFSAQHNRIRFDRSGRGTFDLVVRNARRALAKGVSVAFLVTVTNTNVSSLPHFLGWLAGRFHNAINLNVMMDNGTRNTMFSRRYFEQLDRFFRYAITNKWINFGLVERREALDGHYAHERFCCAIGSQLSFLPGGLIGPCHGLSGTCYGKKRMCYTRLDDSIKVKNNALWKRWRQSTAFYLPACYNDCSFFALCGGACPQQLLVKFGNLCARNEDHCRTMRIVFRNQMLHELRQLKASLGRNTPVLHGRIP